MLKVDDIFQDYAKLIYKYLYSLCRNEDLAEELMQETFYQAVKSQKNYNGTCKVSTWLCQIAKHLWYQELDRMRKEQGIPLEETLISKELSLDDQIIQKEALQLLSDRVQALDELSQEVFLLRVNGELSFRDIGNALDRSENWARVTFYRIKQKVMKGWDENEM